MPATFTGWPPGMRIIARRERPHPGAQLRITDQRGWRITVFATNTGGGRLAELEVRHRLRARAEDRIRGLKDTGLRNLPLQEFAKNQIWLELVHLAAELLTWTQLLAWPDQPARTWEPKRLRLRVLAVAGRIITTGRRRVLRVSRRWPWTDLITGGHHRLAALDLKNHPPQRQPGTRTTGDTAPGTLMPTMPITQSQPRTCHPNLTHERSRLGVLLLAEEGDGLGDAVFEPDLRRPAQHFLGAADVEAGPPQVAKPRRVELRLIGCTGRGCDRRM